MVHKLWHLSATPLNSAVTVTISTQRLVRSDWHCSDAPPSHAIVHTMHYSIERRLATQRSACTGITEFRQG